MRARCLSAGPSGALVRAAARRRRESTRSVGEGRQRGRTCVPRPARAGMTRTAGPRRGAARRTDRRRRAPATAPGSSALIEPIAPAISNRELRRRGISGRPPAAIAARAASSSSAIARSGESPPGVRRVGGAAGTPRSVVPPPSGPRRCRSLASAPSSATQPSPWHALVRGSVNATACRSATARTEIQPNGTGVGNPAGYAAVGYAGAMTDNQDLQGRDLPGEVAGLLLAAGGGRRLGGRPKALLPHRGRPLVEHAVGVLRAAGCERIHVVLAPRRPRCATAPSWATACWWTTRTGPRGWAPRCARDWPRSPVPALAPPLVSLVDQPGIGPAAAARVLGAYEDEKSLVSAAYAGVRGHPVLFGAAHWAGIAETATGDRGRAPTWRRTRRRSGSWSARTSPSPTTSTPRPT